MATTKIEIGLIAPKFFANIDGDKPINIRDYKGKWLILFFYPEDDTEVCTKEACEFRNAVEEKLFDNIEIFGVSPDTVGSHDKFIKKYNLNYHLISDPDKKICKMYDVWGEKTLYGRKFMGIIRTTFIIDNKMKIRHIFKNIKVKSHIAQIQKKLIELGFND